MKAYVLGFSEWIDIGMLVGTVESDGDHARGHACACHGQPDILRPEKDQQNQQRQRDAHHLEANDPKTQHGGRRDLDCKIDAPHRRPENTEWAALEAERFTLARDG